MFRRCTSARHPCGTCEQSSTAMHCGTVCDFSKCCTHSGRNPFHMLLAERAGFSTNSSDTLRARSRQFFIQNLQGFIQACMSNFQKYDFCKQLGQSSFWIQLALPIKFHTHSLNFLLCVLFLQRTMRLPMHPLHISNTKNFFFWECKWICQYRSHSCKSGN